MKIEVYDFSGEWAQEKEDIISEIESQSDNFKYWSGSLVQRILFVLRDGAEIAAIGEILNKSRYEEVGICYVSVSKKHRGKKYGSQIISYIFKWIPLQDRWKKISMSEYSVMGFFLLKPTIDKLKKECPLDFHCYNELRPGYPFVDDDGKMHWASNEEEFEELKNEIRRISKRQNQETYS
jgi:GNAT superfamily N-acetyltransferase